MRYSPLSTPSATREVLERHGLYTKYGLGQNFLVNDAIIGKILDLAQVKPGDKILEVGPGIGTLTCALLGAGASVLAVEKDPDLPAVLAETLQPWAQNFQLLSMDALDLKASDLGAEAPAAEAPAAPTSTVAAGAPTKMVSNLPYAVAATVVLDYMEHFDFLESATVMVQKEVADRMTAKPGTKNYGAYTVKLGLFTQAAGRFPVSPGNFFPPPRVESAVLRLNRQVAQNPETGQPLTTRELQATCTMANAAFANRRKTLANSCKTYFASAPATAPATTTATASATAGTPTPATAPTIAEALPEIFSAAAIDPKRRGETLSQEEFIALGLAYLSNYA